MWNGAAEALNASPTTRRANPASRVPFSNSVFWRRNCAIPVSDADPVAPYTSATP